MITFRLYDRPNNVYYINATTSMITTEVEFSITDEQVNALRNGELELNIRVYVGIGATIQTDVTFDNIVAKPMIRLASDPDDTWQPYAPTNYELMQSDNALAEGMANFGKKLWQGNFTSGSIEVTGAAKYLVYLMEINSVFYAIGGRLNGTGGYATSGHTVQMGGYKLGAQENGDNVIFTIDSTNDGGTFNGQAGPITKIYGLF